MNLSSSSLFLLVSLFLASYSGNEVKYPRGSPAGYILGTKAVSRENK